MKDFDNDDCIVVFRWMSVQPLLCWCQVHKFSRWFLEVWEVPSRIHWQWDQV